MNDLEAVRLLHALVRIPSPTGSESRLARFLAGELVHLGFEAELDAAGNLLAARGEGSANLTFVSHLDTRGAELATELEGDVLRGRGVLLGKGALATFVAVATRLARAGFPLGLRLVALVGGEGGTARGARALTLPEESDCIVVGHTSSWSNVIVGSRGLVRTRLLLQGENARDQRPQGSLAARACAVWSAIQREHEERAADSCAEDLPWIELESVETREVGAMVQAELSMALHLGRSQGTEESLAALASVVKLGSWSAEPGYPAYLPTAPAGPLVRAIANAVSARGADPTTSHARAVSTMCVLGSRTSTPLIGFAPGDGRRAGTAREELAIEEYLRSIEVLTEAALATWPRAVLPSAVSASDEPAAARTGELGRGLARRAAERPLEPRPGRG